MALIAAILLVPAPALAFDGLAFAFALAGAALPGLAPDAQPASPPAANAVTQPVPTVARARTPARFASTGSRRGTGARKIMAKAKPRAKAAADVADLRG
ncbi:hypothetical protein [Salinarimonas soli]|uniref:Uncharacterized protein n=1 Tax=Salinarimonas soli TaxID=1638099 RepID=A0A5B2V499_9HYPH|nr:hypothetical protein [Salinarimonas soli]KAA2233420.1 hypothetical protein F0L46_24550 [Salinarimonas soli]